MNVNRDPSNNEMNQSSYEIYLLGSKNILITETFTDKPSKGDLIEILDSNYEVISTLYKQDINKRYTPILIVKEVIT